MSTTNLHGTRVAILVTEGFEEVELSKPREALDSAGARTQIVSPDAESVAAFNHHDRSKTYPVDVPLAKADANEYDALLLPGGALNPDALRMDPHAVAFVKSFVAAGKPIAAICHAPWLLIEAGAVRGRTLTSWPSLQTDLRNAGATWVDRAVVQDGPLTTSRKPDDIPAFNAAMIESFAKIPTAR